MDVPFLDLKRQRSAAWTAAAQRVLESGWYISGAELATFESVFASYCGASECIGVANGTDALELALRAAGIGAGDEVATVPNAGMYTTTAIRAIGAVPLLVDISDDTLLMCPDSLKAALNPATRAVVVTHLYGAMAPVKSLLEITAAAGIPVIEDCAQAHGAIQNDRKAGSWGVAGCFSFYPTKNLGALGDAGAIVTSDHGFAERVRSLRQYGWTARFHSVVPGGRNSRMDELQAAVLAAKLPSLDAWNERRRSIARRYSQALGACELYRLPAFEDDGFAAHLYVIRCTCRDLVRQRLAARGIGTEIHYPVTDHLQPSQASLPFRSGGTLAISERAAREVLSLPCFPQLVDEEIDFVIRSLVELNDELR